MATVAEMIEALSKFPPEFEVVLSSDAEGNSYSPAVAEAEAGMYVPDTTYSGEFRDEEDHKYMMEEDELEEGDEDYVPYVPNAVTLWPTN